MTLYHYKAMDSCGRILRGALSTSNPAALENLLSVQQLELIHYRTGPGWTAALAGRKMPPAVVIRFFVQLSQLVEAGIPLLDGLRDTAEMAEHPAMQISVSRIISAIERGSTLSGAMSEEHRIFDEVIVALVRAGEQSGQLNRVLEYIVESLKWRDELMTRSRKLMIYPVVTAVVVATVAIFLLLWLVPRLAPFLGALGGQLPWYTKSLLQASDWLSAMKPVHAALPVGLFICGMACLRSRRLRLVRDRMMLRLWMVGDLLQRIACARFSRTLALLYSAGVTLPDALGLCAHAMGNEYLKKTLHQAQDQVTAGRSIADALALTGVFPPMVKRMIRLGETTGKLDKALENVSYFYDREVQNAVDDIQALLPVLMTLVLGALIALMVLAVLGPVYDAVAALRLH